VDYSLSFVNLVCEKSRQREDVRAMLSEYIALNRLEFGFLFKFTRA